MVVPLVALAFTVGCHGDRATRTGAAFGPYRAGGSGNTVHRARVGEHVYFNMETLENRSAHTVRIDAVHVAELPAGLHEVAVRSYLPPSDAAGIAAWIGGDHGPFREDYPPRHSPEPLSGVTLAPHSGLPDRRYLLAEVVVTRPGTYTGYDLTVTYHSDGHEYRETVGRLWLRVVGAKP